MQPYVSIWALYMHEHMHDVSRYESAGLWQLEGGATKSGPGATTSAWTQLVQAAGRGAGLGAAGLRGWAVGARRWWHGTRCLGLARMKSQRLSNAMDFLGWTWENIWVVPFNKSICKEHRNDRIYVIWDLIFGIFNIGGRDYFYTIYWSACVSHPASYMPVWYCSMLVFWQFTQDASMDAVICMMIDPTDTYIYIHILICI